MPGKKPSKAKSPKDKSSAMGHYDVLGTDSIKTSGLTGASRITLKDIEKYAVEAKPNPRTQLEQEKKRAAENLQLLDSIHPGATIPPGTCFAGIHFGKKDLERVRFSDSNFKNCNLRNGQLRDCHWRNSDLSGVDFRKADLRGCILDGCNLNGADLRHANLKGARIIDCNLFAANFDNTMLDKAVIDHCKMGAQSFHNASCKKLSFFSSDIIHGFFDNADFTSAELRNIIFRGCTLTHTRFQNAHLNDCVFRGCDSFQEGPVFTGSKLHKVIMEDCEFVATRMVNTEITHCHWERVEMDSTLFDGAHFKSVCIQQSVLKNCYTLDKAPVFNQCRLDKAVIEHTDLSDAVFNRSSFVGAIIRDSDFSDWQLQHTDLDTNTIIDGID